MPERRQYEDTPAFAERYRFRAGVEATMSEFDRRTGVKHLRVRGMKAVRFAAVMKALGVNILRASRYKKGKRDPESPPSGAMIVALALLKSVWKQFEWQN